MNRDFPANDYFSYAPNQSERIAAVIQGGGFQKDRYPNALA
jgi:hypothetical protein